MTNKLRPSAGRRFVQELPKFTESTIAHPDTWNNVHLSLLDNDVALEAEVQDARAEVDSLGERVGEIEQTSSNSVQRAVKLDWLYRDNRVAHELWAPGFTLIDAVDTEIIEGVGGDDSVDVVSTADLRAGEFYVLVHAGADGGDDGVDGGDEGEGDEGETSRPVELVRCTAVLSDNRIRLSRNLSRSWESGTLTRCSLRQVGAAYAVGEIGDIWLSKPINIGNNISGGAVVIRRSLNSGQARLYFRDNAHQDWTERGWSTRRQGGDIPAGFADYEYILPMRGDGHLRLDIEGEPIIVHHIIALSTPTGLGGFVNPEMRPLPPEIIYPSPGATDVGETPAIEIAGYVSPGGTPQAGLRIVVASDSDGTNVIHDSGVQPASLSYTIPPGLVPAGETTVWLFPYVIDQSGLQSAAGTPVSYTTMASYAYVRPPVIVSPAHGSIDMGETFTIQLDAFATVGDEDVQKAFKLRVREAGKPWSAALWESGVIESGATNFTFPAGIIQGGNRAYFIQADREGESLGWAGWGAEVQIVTKELFANVTGVVLLQAGNDGGVWAHIDADGNVMATPPGSYFNAHPVWGGMQDVIIDGQAMVRVPKFYVKDAYITVAPYAEPLEARWISDQPLSGYRAHPAFMDAGVELDQIYVGKYQASMQGSKLASVPGVDPAVSRSWTQFKADAEARNVGGVSGFMMYPYYFHAAVFWLYLVENAAMDAQARTGQGRVNESSNGRVDAADVAQATYRGIVGLWGNVRQYVDGLKLVDGKLHIWDRNGNQTWVNTGLQRLAAEGGMYPLSFMRQTGDDFDLRDCFIGNTGPTSNAGATLPDRQYMNYSGENVANVGGYRGDGSNAGPGYLHVNQTASYSLSSRGSRLAKK